MANGPPASALCFLSELRTKRAGDKVRFLGCVTAYAVASGVLTLEHAYPQPPATAGDRARVDVRLLVEQLGAEQVRVGEWVNVIGYVTAGAQKTAAQKSSGRNEDTTADVPVQAILLWSAGPLDVQTYERRLAAVTQGMPH
ncbi:Telomere length regulation/capping, TEN1 [Niveomyces insectorum RCEF 264]|uniref:Telomere length regulation/capping, TEN1 n=1 Tax=Niveomyces insectorum RCEF 264 TaxID=1081102 RepID=A0A167RZB8_9HYPO|nr:Telomere length regulation/capping, TEN1 [Niveomyces insectorum RCEF 264]